MGPRTLILCLTLASHATSSAPLRADDAARRCRVALALSAPTGREEKVAAALGCDPAKCARCDCGNCNVAPAPRAKGAKPGCPCGPACPCPDGVCPDRCPAVVPQPMPAARPPAFMQINGQWYEIRGGVGYPVARPAALPVGGCPGGVCPLPGGR